MSQRKVLLIGWDAADWKVLHPLLDAGQMPNLQTLIRNGVMGNLASLRPELSPMLWTSIATGKRPYKHGILGFTEPGPNGKGMRPVTNLSRKTKCIWNILNQNDLRSLVIGWWPSHPAEPINGVMVSNHYQRAVAPHGTTWPIQKGTIFPDRLHKNLIDLRVHPQDIDPGLMELFVPTLAEIDQEKDKRIETIAKIIADVTTINRATCALMHHEEWDFTAVYFDAIDHFCHGFMEYHPPHLSRVSEEEYQRYKHVVTSGYIFHDILLGSLLAEVDTDTTVILVSDHGFHSDHLRPVHIPGEPAGPAAQHRPYGIVLMSGPGIKQDELIYGSSLLDICPTILSCYGLPVGEDMDGKVLANSFTVEKDIQYIPSWDDVAGDDGSHMRDVRIDPLESCAAIKQLIELGYIDEAEEDVEKAASCANRELMYNLAKSYMDAGLHGEGLLILEELCAQWPEEFRFGVELSHCYLAVGKPRESLTLLEKVFAAKKEKAEKAGQELERLRGKLKNKEETENKQQELQRTINQLLQDSSLNSQGMHYLLGVSCHAHGKTEDALEHFNRAEEGGAVFSALCVNKGNLYKDLKQPLKAKKSYEKALHLDSEDCNAILGLCGLELADRQNTLAAHYALDCIALRYHTPMAHYYLGCALSRMGRLDDGIKALKIALDQNPNFSDAARRLAYIYKNRLNMADKARCYQELAREAEERIKSMKEGVLPISRAPQIPSDSKQQWHVPVADPQNDIVIVSGVPRSGTSMMMQILEAGGRAVVTDGRRMQNEDNPKGYFEDERVKRLAKENEWLADCKGKTLKIVAPLLMVLPETGDLSYRVIFMERNLAEVVKSQEKMLINLGRGKKRQSDLLLQNGFLRQVEQSKALMFARKIPVLYISYHDCISDPLAVIIEIDSFLGGNLDTQAMVDIVDSSLWRNRVGAGSL